MVGRALKFEQRLRVACQKFQKVPKLLLKDLALFIGQFFSGFR